MGDNMEGIALFNLCFGITSILCTAVALFTTILTRKVSKMSNRFFIALLLVNMFLLISNVSGVWYSGKLDMYAVWIFPIVTFFEFALTYLLPLIFIFYIYWVCEISFKDKKRYLVILVFVVCFIMLIINLFAPFIYSITDNNTYKREICFYLPSVLNVTYLVYGIVLLAKYRKKMDFTGNILMNAFLIIPTIAMVLTVHSYGLYYEPMATTICLVILFFYNTKLRVERYYSMELESEELKTKMMLSQIQPHFLFNTLSAIACLTDDPKETREAITDFAKYLRGNLDSLSYNEPVPFSKELLHVQTYLKLEKIRFEDKIRIEYDLQELNFNVPTLSVQILVENAVKHGITKKNEGGFVRISTLSDDDNYYIIVEDDGIGFDVNKNFSSERSHVGLTNLQNRIKRMVGGTFNISSTVGVGTTATIIIPRKR